MIRRLILVLVLLGIVVLASIPAQAMCTAGRVELRGGKPYVELPRCETHPQ